MYTPTKWEPDSKPLSGRMMFLARPHECDACGNEEERIWTDSFTGKELCNECISTVAQKLTNSPASEGDNLKAELLKAGRLEDGDDEDGDDEDGVTL